MGATVSRPEIPESLTTRLQKRRFIRRAIDAHGFRWLVYAVAASGFLTDSWNLFATNAILPSLAFVYWPEETSGWRESLINCMTLGGSAVGQLLFGYLADKYGRTRLYGIELVIVLFTTIALSASSTGVNGSIAVLPWIASMRFLMGVGIGAEYPLSASICTEWASTSARAKMMVAVFLMQPLGQLISQLVAYGVLLGYNKTYNLQSCRAPSEGDCGKIVDMIWRWVAGVGAIPALIAIIFRFQINDPGLYDLDVKDEGTRAVQNTMTLYGYRRMSTQIPDSENDGESIEMSGDIMHDGHHMNGAAVHHEPEEELPEQFSRKDLKDYFITQGNWRSLAGTSMCWLLLDIAFYGLGLSNPGSLAKLWAYVPEGTTLTDVPSWNPNAAKPQSSIFEALRDNAIQNLVTVCVGSMTGCLLLLLIIDYIPRKEFLTYSFVWMAVLFFICGGSFFSVFHNDFHAVSIVLVALCYFSFNLGPNTLTFVIPAEIFPTRYRATCHGIAAAAGKLGSVLVQSTLPSWTVNGVHVSDPNSNGLGWVFITYGFVMALGAVSSWAWIPSLQEHHRVGGGADAPATATVLRTRGPPSLRLPSKTLEILGKGIVQARNDGELIGMRDNFVHLWSRLWKKSRRD
ncbi:major facilitator superfamily domain-containing protein [Lasiosphaeria miniovina]|uniref:Major facilitator superfamily domain-containing protein n=1 Tax=Lasiosphaeria miniovina TaxID=1954250 RepID=A0AA39ZZ31_9PEZI|nr:major facilitator superfamily domain-containing protein [Lasiosphaeria miniovina]KAK0706306.1 major facilitator superfamily domain-containing protein [Lasiosphaeria miniovina]